MRILLTTRRAPIEPRNPIALLELAPYLRAAGHSVECRYLHAVQDNATRYDKYDVVGLSVLQALNDDRPLRDALILQNHFRTRTVVGRKWTRSMAERQRLGIHT